MNESEQTTIVGAGSGVDRVKNWLAIALLIAGIAAFYWFGDRPVWQRWLLMLGGLVAAIAVFASAHDGRRFWRFVLDSRVELRKVFWPQRQETMMTTMIIFVFMIVAGLGFWALDTFLAWATRILSGQGS